MLRIVRATEPLSVDRVNICIYSHPGMGKTTLGFTSEAPLLLDCDNGAYRASNRKDIVPVSCWDDIANITAADLSTYRTVVLDTAGRALDLLSLQIIADNPKMGRGGALTLQGYGELKARFTAWLKLLRGLGKDCILLSHMDEQRSGDDVIERLDVQGGSKGEIYKCADAMGRIVLRNGERFLDFNPRDHSFGKNPCALPILPLPPEGEDTLGQVIATIKDRLNRCAEDDKAEQERIRDWQNVLAEIKTLAEMNERVPEIRRSGSKVIALANNRAREMSLSYDRAQGKFVPKASAPTKGAAA